MKTAMISMPMNGRSCLDIYKDWEFAAKYLQKKGYEVLDTLFEDEDLEEGEDINIPLKLLSMSLERMSHCETVFFLPGWEKARGCQIEHEAAKAYGLETIYGE